MKLKEMAGCSIASARKSIRDEALLEQYSERVGAGIRAATEEMRRMDGADEVRWS
jgi:hypothetical protein